MEKYKQGDIIYIPYPFTDLSATKKRPAVIISKVNSNKQDVIVAFISSIIPHQAENTDYVLNISDKDFSETGLKKKSIFKMDKLATLEKTIFSAN